MLEKDHFDVQYDFHYIRWCLYRLSVTRQVLLVKQEVLTLPEHMSSPRFILGWSFFSFLCSVLCTIVFPFSFCHCIICPYSINDSWLPLWFFHIFFVNCYVKCHVWWKKNARCFFKIWGDVMWKQKILPLWIPIVICLNNVITNSIVLYHDKVSYTCTTYAQKCFFFEILQKKIYTSQLIFDKVSMKRCLSETTNQ